MERETRDRIAGNLNRPFDNLAVLERVDRTCGEDVRRGRLNSRTLLESESQSDVDLHQRDGRGRTVLLTTATITGRSDQATLLNVLLRGGANIHDWDDDGNTALHLALMAARPDEHWTVKSLSALIQAGADPSQTNHDSSTCFDIASDASPELGSFRRDLLLQALLDAQMDIPDERLLLPTKFTSLYTSNDHALISGVGSTTCVAELRSVLMKRLTAVVDPRFVDMGSKFYESAVDRTFSANSGVSGSNQDAALNAAKHYLLRMANGRKELIDLIERRLPFESWGRYGKNVDWTKLDEEAFTEALLDFDWRLEVDQEDVLRRYIHHLVAKLEKIQPGGQEEVVDAEGVGTWIKWLQQAVPGQSVNAESRQDQGLPAKAPKVVTFDENRNQVIDDATPQDDRQRQQSIVKTPIQFYRPESKILVPETRTDEGYWSTSPSSSNNKSPA